MSTGWATRFIAALAFLAVCVAYSLVALGVIFTVGITMFMVLPSYVMDVNLMTNMKAKFTELMAWVKAGLPDDDSLISTEFKALIVVPLILIVVSLRALIFGKDALLHYKYSLRYSVEYGWLCGCFCIAAYILSRPFKHLTLMKVVLFIFGLFSALMLYSDVNGYHRLLGMRFQFLNENHLT